MKMHRMRFTVRRLIVALMVLAVGLAVMVRRHPVGGIGPIVGLGIVYWSDGSMMKGRIPVPTNFSGFGPFLNVGWSDGSTSWYLGRIARTDDVYSREKAEHCVETLRSDPSEPRRIVAADWLTLHSHLVEPDLAVPVLAALAVSDPSPKLRLTAVVALSGFITRSSPAIQALADALEDRDGVVRVMAAYSLKDTPAETNQSREIAIPALLRALQDRNSNVRSRAAKSLRILRGQDDVEAAKIECASV